MEVIRARNVNDAWDQAKVLLNAAHIVRPSRVGEVWEYPVPVTTVYDRPQERILFNEERNVNPYFHFMEGLWMLSGSNEIAWLVQFNKRMVDFSDDGIIQHGAYGHRWRRAFDLDGGAEDDYADQLGKIVRMLKKNPNERRAVLTMWNPLWDLERPELKDVPCNTQIYFKIRPQFNSPNPEALKGALSMIVTCRSNDIVWGCYGANVVHMSMLQEYMAAMIGVPMGPYYQVSDSWHAYTERWEQFGGNSKVKSPNPYVDFHTYPYRMVECPETFDADLERWMLMRRCTGANPFFEEVAEPLMKSWEAYKRNDFEQARIYAALCEANDLRKATLFWLQRIEQKRGAKA